MTDQRLPAPVAFSGTLIDGLLVTCRRFPDAVALQSRRGDSWVTYTWSEYLERGARIAAGLLALGVRSGDRVLLMIGNRPEFHFVDVGVLLAGAVPVSVYPTAAGVQLRHLIADSGALVALVEDDEQAARLRSSGIRHVVTIDVPSAVTLADLSAHDQVDVDRAAAALGPDDLVTVIYTSGTTGPAKGVLLAHDTILGALDSTLTSYQQDWSGRRLLSYLPMAHIAERNTSHYLPMMTGAEVTPVPEASQLGSYLLGVRPHLFVGVPRVFEKLAATVQAAIATDPTLREAGLHVGTTTNQLYGAPWSSQMQTAAKALIGLDQCLVAITGAAPTPDWVVDVLRAIDVPLSEGYGLSECCGTLTLDPFEPRRGTVGRVVPGGEIRIADDGEVMFRGRNVFRGYLGNPQASTEAIDQEGWLRTGDLGSLDADGYLRIVDRKKDIIITSGGKNVPPLPLEHALRACPLIAHAVVVGDGRPYLGALIVLDSAAAQVATSSAQDPEVLSRMPAIHQQVLDQVQLVNSTVSRPERIRRFRILAAEWRLDSTEITPTGKVRRRAVIEKYQSEIEALYAAES